MWFNSSVYATGTDSSVHRETEPIFSVGVHPMMKILFMLV